MQAGRLRQTVSIEQRAAGVDSFGEQLATWSTFLSGVPASVTPLSGREFMTAGAFDAELSHRVIMRYVDGVTAAMRVNFGGRYLVIKSVINEEERGRQLTLMCAEGLTDA